jgi:hypothetical protein
VVGTPEACGHRVFERSAAVAGSETWYMEIFEAHDEAIGCVVHAAGFGQSSPIHSGVVTDFSLGLEKDKTALPIASFEARCAPLTHPLTRLDPCAAENGPAHKHDLTRRHTHRRTTGTASVCRTGARTSA